MKKITFNYSSGMEDIINHNLALNEDKIREKLSPCFEQQKIKIEEILVKLSLILSHSSTKYSCHISIISPDIDFNLEESGNDYSLVIHVAIEKTLSYIHKEKQKIADIL